MNIPPHKDAHILHDNELSGFESDDIDFDELKRDYNTRDDFRNSASGQKYTTSHYKRIHKLPAYETPLSADDEKYGNNNLNR